MITIHYTFQSYGSMRQYETIIKTDEGYKAIWASRGNAVSLSTLNFKLYS